MPLMSTTEPRNPFYILLLLASFLFVLTALGVAVVPLLMDKAQQAGGDVPAEGFHQVLKRDGVWWLLYQVAGIIVLAVLSMGLDRLRSLKKERAAGTIPPSTTNPSSPPDG
jgi:hypothetical protein